jgi:hypothetical protein
MVRTTALGVACAIALALGAGSPAAAFHGGAGGGGMGRSGGGGAMMPHGGGAAFHGGGFEHGHVMAMGHDHDFDRGRGFRHDRDFDHDHDRFRRFFPGFAFGFDTYSDIDYPAYPDCFVVHGSGPIMPGGCTVSGSAASALSDSIESESALLLLEWSHFLTENRCPLFRKMLSRQEGPREGRGATA